jgi:hypothetical protein
MSTEAQKKLTEEEKARAHRNARWVAATGIASFIQGQLVTLERESGVQVIPPELAAEALSIAMLLTRVPLAELHRRLDSSAKKMGPILEQIDVIEKALKGVADAGTPACACGRPGCPGSTAPAMPPRVCQVCREAPRGNDPALQNDVCAFCGYWGIPPGEAREILRADRLKKSPS